MYDPGYEGRVFEAPTYGLREKMGMTPREVRHIRSRYAGEVTMVDTWFGYLCDKLRRLEIMDETVVIFNSDHGTNFDGPGEFGLVEKIPWVGADGMIMSGGHPAKEPLQYFPLPVGTARIPLMIRMPDATPHRVEGIVQPWDMTATLLDLFGIKKTPGIIGNSLLPMVRGETGAARPAAVLGNNTFAQAMDGRWMYTTWRGQREPALYDLEEDPGCEVDLAPKEADVAGRLHGALEDFMKQQDVDADVIGGFRRVNTRP
jgi:arylsulfatase A-like enzyme